MVVKSNPCEQGVVLSSLVGLETLNIIMCDDSAS